MWRSEEASRHLNHPEHVRYGLAEDLKLSALGRQPEDVEFCIVCFCFGVCCVLAGHYVSILTDAMIQVWGRLATSLMRY
ncbi:hypothetical protein Hanom_Chr11g01049141 [Helianthus anomalus]